MTVGDKQTFVKWWGEQLIRAEHGQRGLSWYICHLLCLRSQGKSASIKRMSVPSVNKENWSLRGLQPLMRVQQQPEVAKRVLQSRENVMRDKEIPVRLYLSDRNSIKLAFKYLNGLMNWKSSKVMTALSWYQCRQGCSMGGDKTYRSHNFCKWLSSAKGLL